MTKRKLISKRVRFEVFKRDSFKCQYCGNAAPEVVLQLDHISPVSRGGKSDILNLITSCGDCNSGKSNVELTDDAAIKKQKAQLDELNLRREQLEMLVSWRKELSSLSDRAVEACHDAYKIAARGWYLNDGGLATLRKYVTDYGVGAVLGAIETARNNYLKPDRDGKLAQDQVDRAWSKIGGICRMSDKPEWKRQLFYIRGIIRNRFTPSEFRDRYILSDLEAAFNAGVDTEHLKVLALEARYISEFDRYLEDAVKKASGDGKGT